MILNRQSDFSQTTTTMAIKQIEKRTNTPEAIGERRHCHSLLPLVAMPTATAALPLLFAAAAVVAVFVAPVSGL